MRSRRDASTKHADEHRREEHERRADAERLRDDGRDQRSEHEAGDVEGREPSEVRARRHRVRV